MNVLQRLCKSQEFRGRLERSRDRLYRVAYSWCHNPDLAEDLVQETLSKALVRADQLRDPDALVSWLLRIMTNEFRDHLRRQRPMSDVDDIVLEEPSTLDSEHERGEVVSTVRGAVQKLPFAQRQVLTLVDLEGLSYKEVAEVLEIPIGTVMSRLCRGRHALRELLHEYRAAGQKARTPIRRVK